MHIDGTQRDTKNEHAKTKMFTKYHPKMFGQYIRRSICMQTADEDGRGYPRAITITISGCEFYTIAKIATVTQDAHVA